MNSGRNNEGEKNPFVRERKGQVNLNKENQKEKRKKSKDGMFYWEGARQIIARKFYF